ncbi:MAG: hypothetical protein JNM88_21205, partial [Chitinophagaceae bacterium]|nr:hypothetical protein [Chitinophagaceae bacterium]
MTLNQPESYYRQRIASLTEGRKFLIRRRNMLAWLRFISVAAAFAAFFIAWPYSAVLAIALFILFTGLFTNFLVRDLSNRFAIQNTDRLLLINENEVKILDHDFLHLPDGHSFSEPAHPYAGDLDIFGRASLYQYINRTTTEQGASELAILLLNPCDEDEIRLRQQAAIELAGKPVFRQQLHAYGLAEPVTINTEMKINNWLVEESPFVSQYVWQTARVLLPAISLSLLVLYLINVIPASTFTPCIVLMMVTAYTISRMVNKAHISLSRIAPQLGSLSNSIQLIEETSFE